MPKVNTDPKKIEELLTRGVEQVYPTREFLEKELKSGRQLTLYTGYDPTAPTLHIGHAITMRKLRQFQDLGHKVIMLIGDFTGLIGDPTDKTAARVQLTREQVLENCKEYQKQASAFLDFGGDNPVELKYNSKWLGKLNFGDVLELTSYFTVQRMLERDMFEKRMRGEVQCPFCDTKFTQPYYTLADLSTTSEGRDFANITKCPKCGKTVREMLDKGDSSKFLQMFIPKQPIYLHEFLYPVMQAYDSVAMDVDGEVGGNDQTFNMLCGRDLMKSLKKKEKFVLTMKLLTDPTGKKMGKSEGNMIALSDSPEDMFGKVMSWTDGMIVGGFDLCTNLSADEVKNTEKELKAGVNPRDLKLKLAHEVVKAFVGEEAAQAGEEYFISTFSKKQTPDEMPELKPAKYEVAAVLVEAKICASSSEARRAIDQGGVKINDKKVEVKNYSARVLPGDVVQKGSRHFVRVK